MYLPRLKLILRRLLRRRTVERELDEEIQAYVASDIEEKIALGISPVEARRRALVELGGTEQLKETMREKRNLAWLDGVIADFRYSFRTLRKSPGFACVAVFTLGLGIGANTAIFSVVYACLLKPLPYDKPEQLFSVFQEQARDASVKTGWSYPNFSELREQTKVFSGMAGFQFHQLTLTGRVEPTVVNTSVVTPELFSVFGEHPIAGRGFSSEDGKTGASPVVILSEGLWRTVFGGDPGIVGTSIDLDKHSFLVVGIMPTTFRFPILQESQQVWIPLVQDPLFGGWMDGRGGHWLRVIGRLRPGISMSQAQAECDVMSARLSQEFPAENSGWTIRMVPLQEMIAGSTRSPLLLLFGAVGLVLLLACTNVANLLLARATSRTREIAVRAALGAGRPRIVRQLLSETAVLGVLGGATGIILAYIGVQSLSAMLPAGLPVVNAIHVDFYVLCFALALSIFASCLLGLAPALLVAKSSLQVGIREGGARSGESMGGRQARKILAEAEVAIAMVLLVAAGLLLRSFAKLTAVSPGFDVEHVIKADVSLPRFEYSTPQQWATFADELLTRIQAEPGMQDSAVAVPLPIAQGYVNLAFQIVGSPPLSAASSRTANYVSISTEYFRVMGIPLVSGRIFDKRDVMSAPRVALISSAMARIYFGNQDPVGKHIEFGLPPDSGASREIVGVVGDVRDIALGEAPRPMMYVPYAQSPFWGAGLVVKSTLSTSSVATAIRRDVAAMDKDLPVTDVARMPDLLQTSVAEPRFRTFLLALFAAIALILAATGVFGVISYSVSRRTNEIGVRMALGASRSAIVHMVLRETLTLTIVGVALGLPSALGASHLFGHLLFGVSPNDAVTLAIVGLILMVVAILAGCVPLRRAIRVDPLVALRHD